MKIYCDGAYNSKTKPFAWASVVDDKENDLLCTLNAQQCCNSIIETIQTEHSKDLKSSQVLQHLQCDTKHTQKSSVELKKVACSLFKKKKEQQRCLVHTFFNDAVMQNNGAELVACLFALCLINAKLVNCNEICLDSNLILLHWSKKCGPSVKDPLKRLYINRLIHERYVFEQEGGKLSKISGNNNPADLGAHTTTK